MALRGAFCTQRRWLFSSAVEEQNLSSLSRKYFEITRLAEHNYKCLGRLDSSLLLVLDLLMLEFKAELSYAHFYVVTLVQLGPIKVCMYHTYPWKLEITVIGTATSVIAASFLVL